MLFLARGERDAEPHEPAQREHSAARHRHPDQTLLLHSLVYLTLEYVTHEIIPWSDFVTKVCFICPSHLLNVSIALDETKAKFFAQIKLGLVLNHC